jgi:hypothetical protein
MITRRRLETNLGMLTLVLGINLLAACGPSAPAGQTDGAPAASPRGSSGGGAADADKVNMEEIFPPGAGRDLVLNNCQNCHTFVPIVILQMDDDAWTRNSRDHRMRVSGLSDDEFNTAYAYLKKNFNQNHPVPKLPQVLLESWTTA